MRGKGGQGFTEDDYYDEEDDYYEEDYEDEEAADNWEDEYDDHVAGKKTAAAAAASKVGDTLCARARNGDVRRPNSTNSRRQTQLVHPTYLSLTTTLTTKTQQASAKQQQKAPAAAAGASAMARGLCDAPPPRPSGKPQPGGKCFVARGGLLCDQGEEEEGESVTLRTLRSAALCGTLPQLHSPLCHSSTCLSLSCLPQQQKPSRPQQQSKAATP